MTAPVAYLVSLGLFFVAAVTRPTRARCPGDWYVEGVRPSGAFDCRPVARTIREYRTVRGGWTVDVVPDERRIDSQIYCTSGQEPIVVSDRVVSCQARH